MAKILLDYSIPFTQVSGVGAVNLSYLKNVAVIATHKTGITGPPVINTITDITQATALTDATDLEALFSGGLNQFYLITCEDLDAVETAGILDATSHYTALISNTFDQSAISAWTPTYSGVVSAAFDDNASATAYTAQDKYCAFLDDSGSPRSYGMYYAFAKLLSGTFWRDQQYVEVVSSNVYAVDSLGDANNLFNSRVSFYLDDEEFGKRLGFFAAGGDGITAPYIDEEIKRILQSSGTNYLALNQPKNITASRIRLQRRLNGEIGTYIEPPYQYLDDTVENSITVTESNERFVVNGSLSTKVAEPIWRLRVEALQE